MIQKTTQFQWIPIFASLVAFIMPMSTFSRDFVYSYNGIPITYTVIDETDKTVMTKCGEVFAYGVVAGNAIDFRGVVDFILPEHPTEGDDVYTLKEIGDYSFDCLYSSCPVNVIIPGTVEKIGVSAFETFDMETLILGDGVKSIGECAFGRCRYLTSISFSNTLESIGDNAFNSNDRLTSITLPESIKEIGESAFLGCINLSSVILPKYLEVLSDGIFNHCINLSSINIPESVTEIGGWAFTNTALETIDIPNSVITIGDSSFESCEKLISVNLPNSVVSIGESAFSFCVSLKSLDLSDSLKTIGNNAFTYCINLNTLTLGKSLTQIGSYAFSECYNLTELSIPETVIEMGESVFWQCKALKKNYPSKCANSNQG